MARSPAFSVTLTGWELPVTADFGGGQRYAAGLLLPSRVPSPGATGITDGTSNTIMIGEGPPGGSSSPRRPGSPAITDGSSNTIQFGEGRSGASSSPRLPGSPAITDGSSNTILFGEGRSGACSSPRPPGTPAITDGTSNTILFGELVTRVRTDPLSLRSGFGLLLPAVVRGRFQSGRLLPAFRVLPYMEADRWTHSVGDELGGLHVQACKVTRLVIGIDGIAIWVEPQGIIAILIGL